MSTYKFTGGVPKAKKTFKTPKAILRHLLALYEKDPNNWVAGARWRPLYHGRGNATSVARNQFCLLGGIEHFAADEDAFHAACEALKPALPKGQGIIQYNDDRKSVKPIITRLKKAVA